MGFSHPTNYDVFGNYYVTYNPRERTRTIYDKSWNRLMTVDDSELNKTLDELEGYDFEEVG